MMSPPITKKEWVEKPVLEAAHWSLADKPSQ
jgi:hypothetical protein